MTQYTIHVQQHRRDSGVVWKAWHPALPGCQAEGETPGAAQTALAECRAEYLQGIAASGLPPPPGDTDLKQCLIFVH